MSATRGVSVSDAGDINGDNIDDLIVGAYNNGGNDTDAGPGAAYVVFGRTGGFATPVSPIPLPIGTYDAGWYNLGVRPTADDIGLGRFFPVVDKGDEINLGARRQHLEDVIRAHTISAVLLQLGLFRALYSVFCRFMRQSVA